MCQHVARGHWMQGRGDVSVDLGHQVGRARRSLGQSRKDLVFACLSMRDQPAQPLSRVRDCFAVTRQKLREALIAQHTTGHHKRPEVAIGRRDQRRCPTQHGIARNGDPAVACRHHEGKVTCEMTGRVQGCDAPVGSAKFLAVNQRGVGFEACIQAFAPARQSVGCQASHNRRPSRLGWSEGQDGRIGCPRQSWRQGRVIAVRMGDQDMGDRRGPRSAQYRSQMCRIVRAGVDHGHAGCAQQIGVGARTGHRGRVRGQNPSHTGGDENRHACTHLRVLQHLGFLPMPPTRYAYRMGFAWLKRFMPRTLYGRAAAILVVPIFVVQFLISFEFIQRFYDDVTVRMTETMILGLFEVHRLVDTAATAEAGLLAANTIATPLGLDVSLTQTIGGPDEHRLTDLAGAVIVRTLQDELPPVAAVRVHYESSLVEIALTTQFGPLLIEVPRRRFTASNPHQLLVIIMFFTAIVTFVAYRFLRNQLRPITRLSAAAEAFGKGQAIEYNPGGATEVRAAGAAFLDMRNRIERAIEQRTLMLSGVSHDLRTPLTRLKLSLSMFDETPEVTDLLRDVSDMERLIDDFLAFARGDAMEEPVHVDPVTLAQGVVDKAARAGGDVVFQAPAKASAPIMLKPHAVERALSNLVGNALRYGNHAQVSVGGDTGQLRLIVEDDGPGIAPADRDAATRAFIRLDEARNQDRGTGVGLGLAIARDVARGHGGALELGDSASLGGLRAVLWIPR
jgi:two-component system, OmpR family, osmolarity sensor histidine kinase EnvZ